MNESAVEFSTERRVHIGLAVRDVESSRRFYQTLFEREPSKTRPGYARFEFDQPPLNLSIIQSDDARGPADSTSHFGIQVKSSQGVEQMRSRFETMGLETRVERSVLCCHAVQDKVWVTDPDGHRWEVFVVTDDRPTKEDDTDDSCCPSDQTEPCCTTDQDSCCT